MARIIMRKEDPWMIRDVPDIRTWEVRTREGDILGLVEDVYVDPHDHSLAGFVTASGREFSPANMEAENGVVYVPMPEVLQSIRSIVSPYGSGAGAPAATDDPDSFDAHYRTHFESVYGRSGSGFESFLPAYRFGRQQALEPRFSGRPYARAEEELRALFELSHPGAPFTEMREAVLYGYEAGSSVRPARDLEELRAGDGPLQFEWDRNLIRPVGEPLGAGQAGRTAGTMAVGSAPQNVPDDAGMESQQQANREGA